MADTPPSTSPTDPLALSKSIKDRYRNVSLATVNDHEIRMSVMTEQFGWHRHPDSDETFLCVDGELVIEFEDGEVAVAPGQLVTVPAGTAAMPLDLTALSGNGSVNIDVSGATLKNLGVNGKGDITVRAPTTKGAGISVVAEQADDVNLLLPSSFAADEVYFVADADKIVNNVSDLQLTSAEGGQKGSRGTAGTGAKSVKLTSKPFAGSSGQVILGTF